MVNRFFRQRRSNLVSRRRFPPSMLLRTRIGTGRGMRGPRRLYGMRMVSRRRW